MAPAPQLHLERERAYAGEMIRGEILNSSVPQIVTLSWRLPGVEQSRRTIRLGANASRPVSFRTTAALTSPVRLIVQISDDTRAPLAEAQVLLFPADGPTYFTPDDRGPRLLAWDPEASLTKEFRDAGLRIATAALSALEVGAWDVLVVAPDAPLPWPIDEQVANGRRVVLFSPPDMAMGATFETHSLNIASVTFDANLFPAEIPPPRRWPTQDFAHFVATGTALHAIIMSENGAIAGQIHRGKGVYVFNFVKWQGLLNEDPLARWLVADSLRRAMYPAKESTPGAVQ